MNESKPFTYDSIPERSLQTCTLLQALLGVQVNEVITYAALGALIGEHVVGANCYLGSARRAALAEENMLFECVRGHGLKRLGGTEAIEACEVLPKRVRSIARRTKKKLGVVDYNEASADERIRINMLRTEIAFLDLGTRLKTQHLLKEAVALSNNALPPVKMLALFTKKEEYDLVQSSVVKYSLVKSSEVEFSAV